MPYVVAIIAGLAILAGTYFAGYSAGSTSRNPEIVALQAAIETSKELARQAEAKAQRVRVEVQTVYKDRIKVIKEAAPPAQIIEVIRHETPSGCVAPPSVRVLHDRAASGGEETNDSSGTAPAPVEIATLAETVAQNYGICNETAARLTALQTILNSQ